MEDAMSDAGHELFYKYVLEVLARSEKQEGTIDALVKELVDRAAAADIRLCEVEEEVGQLQDALAKHVRAEKMVSVLPNERVGEPEI
jgi:hypothetical protein